jgi:long-chain fatty acid transport protein
MIPRRDDFPKTRGVLLVCGRRMRGAVPTHASGLDRAMRQEQEKHARAFARPAGPLGWACAAWLAACPAAQADAFRIPYQGAAAAGQADAFAGQADDASALYYNPAGLTQLHGVHVSYGTSFVGGGNDFTAPDGRQYHSDYGGDFGFPAPSNYYLVANLKDLGLDALGPLTVGIGLNSPYGLATRWDGYTPFSTSVTRARLPMLNIKPTMAYAVNDWLSLGFGLDIYTFAGFIGAGGYELRALGANRYIGTEFNGDGTVVGYNGSVLLTPWRNASGKPLLNFGLVYRTGERLGLSGNYLVNGVSVAKARTTLVLPEIVSGGLAGWPVRDSLHEWKLEYDMEFVNWSTAQTSDVYLSNGVTASAPLHWHSIYTAAVGTEFKWLDASPLEDWSLALRAGYQHANGPVPHDTLNPQLADSAWNAVAVGVGLGCRGKARFFGLVECGDAANKPFTANDLGLDIAFQTFFYDPRQISGNIDPNVNGHYKTTVYVGSVNFNLSY